MLTVGADGRVKQVKILQTAPRITARVVGAVQRWKFEPAKRGGEPVEGTFQVDLTFTAAQ